MSLVNKTNTYLRVVSNTNCNYNCFFCHHEGEQDYNKILSKKVILEVIESRPYLKKIKITGGEPLLRNGLSDLIKDIRSVSNAEVSLTTNGYFLKDRVKKLYESGLQRISVSLHSLDKIKYEEITGVDGIEKVMEGLDEAKKYYDNIKINTVISLDNIDELDDFIIFGKNNSFGLKALCFMPVSNDLIDQVVKKEDLFNILESKSSDIIEKEDKFIFLINGVSVELKKTILYESCNNCDYLKNCEEGEYAIRLDINGNLKDCLYKNEI